MKKRVWWILGLALAFLIAVPFLLVAWFWWRCERVTALCKHAHAGMPVAELLALERRDGIDDSYLVQALFKDYTDQMHSRDLEFRPSIYDPPLACAITHDGTRVTHVQFLEMKEW